MIKRLKPDQIQAGKSYLLRGRYSPVYMIREVEEIKGDKVLLMINGKMKEFSLKRFADLAVEEVQQQSTVGS